MFIEKEFFVGINNCNENLEITDLSILNFLEEIAGIHSNKAGFGVYQIPETHKSWIALGWKVEIIRRPKYLENLFAKTWCKSDEKNLYSFRDFEIRDSKNDLIVKATSKWVLVDAFSKKILKLNQEIADSYGYENINVFDSINNFKFRETQEETDKIATFKIDKTLIDFNKHLHNTNYLKIAEDFIPKSENANFVHIEIMYKKEIKLGDKINIYHSQADNKHTIIFKSLDDTILHSIIKLY